MVLLKSPDVDAHEFRVAGPWLQEEIWCFAIAKRWFQNWNCKKKTLDFVFFKADHPDSSLMIMWIFFVNEMEHAICYLYSPYKKWTWGTPPSFHIVWICSSMDIGRFLVNKVGTTLFSHFSRPQSSPFRSTLNTGYIKLWTCVKYVPKQSIP